LKWALTREKLYPSTDGPRYVKGHATTLGLIAFEAFLATGMTIYFSRVNKARLIGKEDYKMDSKTEAEIREMADDSPRFLYTV
jgi:maleate cis-trans isomerase